MGFLDDQVTFSAEVFNVIRNTFAAWIAVTVLAVFVGMGGPTTAQQGAITPPAISSAQQHEANRQAFDRRDGRAILNLAEKAKKTGEDVAFVAPKGMPFFPNDGSSLPPESVLENMTCSANAVVIASVTDLQSDLSHNQSWVFTEYLLHVEQILKNNSVHAVRNDKDLVVTRSGGRVKTADGHQIRVDDENFPDLRKGATYLLFLKYGNAGGQYTSEDARGTFRVIGGRLEPVSDDHVLAEIARTYSSSTIGRPVQSATCKEGTR